MSASTPRSIGIIGGGTAGYFAALAVKRRFPAMDVVVVEAPAIPIIGVGEATTTLMPPFLFGQLGIDPSELHEQVRPTFKLAIRFDWGAPGAGDFLYPFGPSEPLAAYVHDGTLDTQSLTSMLALARKAPLSRDADGAIQSLLPQLKFAYHLHNAPFVAFLSARARSVGIHHVEAEIASTTLRADGGGIDGLRTTDGRDLRFDWYVDASGFRSVLVGGALGSPFQSFASSLFCDSAVIGELPARDELDAYTFAETMDAGWCWNIPVEDANHRGYVFSSAFLDRDAAEQELRRKSPGLRDTWSLRFRSGRHRDFWIGNTVAIGNAYGFVEPLESTALHMVILEIAWLLAGIEAGDAVRREATNATIGAHWDYLRWFLAGHYKWNRRLATPFWKACENDLDVSGLASILEVLHRDGIAAGPPAGSLVDDPAFGANGLRTILLGVDGGSYSVRTQVPEAPWRARVDRQRAYVREALSHREALALLRARPELLRAMVEGPKSWIAQGAERVDVRTDATIAHMPHRPATR